MELLSESAESDSWSTKIDTAYPDLVVVTSTKRACALLGKVAGHPVPAGAAD